MYCRQCGFNNDKYSKMCKRCGSDLTRPEEAYTPEPSEPGKLRFAPKKESFAELFKRRFKRLERVALDKKRRRPFLVAAVCMVLAAAALIAVPRISACMKEVPDTYGSTACNVVTGGAAVVEGDFLYCSQYVGDNPGLYRIKLSTGEQLKISWRTLSAMSWYDGWLYGLDENGVLIRMSGDGLQMQQVLDEPDAGYISIYNGEVYYLSQDGYIFCASLDEVDEYSTASARVVGSGNVCEMMLFDGWIYYIEQTGICCEPGVPMDSVIDPEYEPGKISWITGKEIPPDYRVDAVAPDKPMGNIYRMRPDGTGNELLVDESVCNLSAYDDYLYYMTPTVYETPATEFDPKAPARITIRASSCQFWRYNLKTMKYTRFLDDGVSRSPLNVTDTAICFVSLEGDLEICPVNGGDHVLLPTEAQEIEAFAIYNNTAYFVADDTSRVGWITIGERVPTTLWTARWGSVGGQPQQTESTESSSDAA